MGTLLGSEARVGLSQVAEEREVVAGSPKGSPVLGTPETPGGDSDCC